MVQASHGGELAFRPGKLFGTPRSQWADPDEYMSPTTPASTTVQELTYFWLNVGALLADYPDPQIAQGLNILINPSWSDYALAINDQDVTDEDRDRCIHAIFTVFSDIFAPRCGTPTAGDTLDGWSLDAVCYMWWDIFPFIHPTCLDVMRDSLQLNSVDCWRSAFHGLGHWHTSYPGPVERIIDEFLARHSSLPAALQRDALQARLGGVL
jgi:hypothetical protein